MDQVDVIQIMCVAMEIYENLCKPFCKEQKLPSPAFDILMFLANHPQYNTAKEIVRYRGIRASLVSLYVDLLVNRGYLTREPVPGDRRSVRLVCTEQAAPVIEKGRELCRQFCLILYSGVSSEHLEVFQNVIAAFARNLIAEKGKMDYKR